MEGLNDELLLEILVRVNLIKCTFRCKCVCKRWLNLINPNPLFPKSDPYFIRRYLLRRADPTPMYCLLHSFASFKFHITTMRNNRGWFRITTLIDGFSLSFLPCPDPTQINILSSANGLILCCPGRYDHSAYFICNPITRQYLSLPPPPLCSDRARSFPGKEKGRVLAALAFEDDLMLNAGCRFRVVCFPKSNESSDLGVEVFSSETGRWATCPVHRPVSSLDNCGLQTLSVCNGIVYWFEYSVFTAFNPWDNSFRFFPAPSCAEYRAIRFFGQSQGVLRAVTFSYFFDSEGQSYEVYALNNGQWFLERVIRLRQLTSKSKWLSRYPWSRGQGTMFIAFHPLNSDMVYMSCKDRIVQCNMQSGEWKEIDKIEGGPIWEHRATVPLMLPRWPTPVPMLPKPE